MWSVLHYMFYISCFVNTDLLKKITLQNCARKLSAGYIPPNCSALDLTLRSHRRKIAFLIIVKVLLMLNLHSLNIHNTRVVNILVLTFSAGPRSGGAANRDELCRTASLCPSLPSDLFLLTSVFYVSLFLTGIDVCSLPRSYLVLLYLQLTKSARDGQNEV